MVILKTIVTEKTMEDQHFVPAAYAQGHYPYYFDDNMKNTNVQSKDNLNSIDDMLML